jgi:hypothetical protein
MIMAAHFRIQPEHTVAGIADRLLQASLRGPEQRASYIREHNLEEMMDLDLIPEVSPDSSRAPSLGKCLRRRHGLDISFTTPNPNRFAPPPLT